MPPDLARRRLTQASAAAGGAYGVPETFVIDRDCRIAYKHIGPVTAQLVDETLRPLIARLRK